MECKKTELNNEIIGDAFTYTLDMIDKAILNGTTLDLVKDVFEDEKTLNWIALAMPVRMYFVTVIDKALTELSLDFQGKYISNHADAVRYYNEHKPSQQIVSFGGEETSNNSQQIVSFGEEETSNNSQQIVSFGHEETEACIEDAEFDKTMR